MEKWTKQQVLSLIEAYRDEPCLYAIKSPNYHNKNLRAAALQRVSQAVRLVRKTTVKECQQKFLNLRNQFNIENMKRKMSIKSGTGKDDVYIPSLWYYEHMIFLDEHVIPRKSKSSPIADVSTNSTIDESNELNEETYDSQVENSDENYLYVVVNEDTDNIPSSQGLLTTSATPLPPSSPLTNFPDLSLRSELRTESSAESPSTSAASPVSYSSEFSNYKPSDFRVPRKNAQKRKKTESDEMQSYVGAIESIAESLKQPISPATIEKPLDTIDSCMQFVGKMLKEIKDEKIKLNAINNILQTVMTAKSTDIQTET